MSRYKGPQGHLQSNTEKSLNKPVKAPAKKEDWIYPGDLCWFHQEAKAHLAGEKWECSENLLRIITPDCPVHYVKRTREGRGGRWVHHIESLGLRYIFKGSIRAFTKTTPLDRGIHPWQRQRRAAQ